MTIEPLRSGYSTDVHGQLTVASEFVQKSYLLHALDTGVRCAALGSAS